MLKQFVKSVGDFEGTLLFPSKRGKWQWYFFFFEESRVFEFVHGKYSEVGGGSLKTMQKYEKLLLCACV